MLLYGDYARLQLTYSESEIASGVPTFGGTVDDGWKYQGWCSLNPMNPVRCNHRYRIEQRWTSTANCGRRVSSSGTAKAKKGLPFGVSRDLVKIGGVSVPISLKVEWGESPSTAIPAASDVSPDCVVTPETCDDPFTEIVETECSGESGSGIPSGPGGSDMVGEFATIAWPSPSPSPSFQERWMCDAESAITPEVVRATIDALNAAFVISKSTADRAVVHYINRSTLSPRLKATAADSALVRALWGSDVRSIDGVGRGRTLRLSSTTKGWIPGPMRVSPP